MKIKYTALVLIAVLMLFSYGCASGDTISDTLLPDATPTASATGNETAAADVQAEPAAMTSPQPDTTPLATTKAEPTAMPAVQLSEGAENDDVTRLQQRLIDLGYLRNASATGYYGDKTQAAVKMFQKQNDLQQDGIAGSEVLSLIYTDAARECTLPLSGYVIGLDPGHQSKANSDLEPIAPGSSDMKKKVSSGTQGRWSRVTEYEVNLKVGLILRDLLEAQGATVIMTRETNDVDISNIERAEIFNDHKTDYALRLHCNGSENQDKNGAFVLIPTENPYLDDCKTAAKLLVDAYCSETGAKNLGITPRSDQTGFNWCERMIINIEMGHMTNKEEDAKLSSSDYQEKMAQGLLDGILAYFEEKE